MGIRLVVRGFRNYFSGGTGWFGPLIMSVYFYLYACQHAWSVAYHKAYNQL
ncbi:hypothetical protein RSAG8_02348, partial [Rhizoctonia solani AG-8 WAC10335]